MAIERAFVRLVLLHIGWFSSERAIFHALNLQITHVMHFIVSSTFFHQVIVSSCHMLFIHEFRHLLLWLYDLRILKSTHLVVLFQDRDALSFVSSLSLLRIKFHLFRKTFRASFFVLLLLKGMNAVYVWISAQSRRSHFGITLRVRAYCAIFRVVVMPEIRQPVFVFLTDSKVFTKISKLLQDIRILNHVSRFVMR